MKASQEAIPTDTNQLENTIMTKNKNNAIVNEKTAAATPTALEVVATPAAAAKPKQFIVGTSENGKKFIDDLCKELQVKGKTGKQIDMPSHAAVDLLIAVATDFRFRTVEVPADVEGAEPTFITVDRFDEHRAAYEAERNQDKPETAEELQRTLEAIQAKLRALGLKA